MLKEKELQLKQKLELVYQKIKKQTQDLQIEARTIETELKDIRQQIETELSLKMADKSVHPIERLIIWLNSEYKETSSWIIDEGPVRDLISDYYERYETVYIKDKIENIFVYELGDYFKDIPEETEMDLNNLEGCKVLFDTFNKDTQNKLTDLIEDVIHQNISVYRQDW